MEYSSVYPDNISSGIAGGVNLSKKTVLAEYRSTNSHKAWNILSPAVLPAAIPFDSVRIKVRLYGR